MTLYEMTEQAAELYDLLCTGEIDEQTFKDTLESIGTDKKIDSYCIVINQLKADAEALKNEKKRLEERIKVVENAQKRIKEELDNFMTAIGKDKDRTAKFTIYHTSSKSIQIADLSAIPDRYIKPRKEDDVMKREIAKAIEDGKEVPGAFVIIKRVLVVR